MKTQQQKGFTIIEVVLVLAIAGLIFLVVFLALPALQRSQRDTQRRNDLSRVAAQLTQFQSNSRGNVPVAAAAATAPAVAFGAATAVADPNYSAGSFMARYLGSGGDVLRDPKGPVYNVQTGVGTATAYSVTEERSTIRYATSARCGDDGVIVAANPVNNRLTAVAISLEGSGAFCQQN